jgi:hypothetical protein
MPRPPHTEAALPVFSLCRSPEFLVQNSRDRALDDGMLLHRPGGLPLLFGRSRCTAILRRRSGRCTRDCATAPRAWLAPRRHALPAFTSMRSSVTSSTSSSRRLLAHPEPLAVGVDGELDARVPELARHVRGRLSVSADADHHRALSSLQPPPAARPFLGAGPAVAGSPARRAPHALHPASHFFTVTG